MGGEEKGPFHSTPNSLREEREREKERRKKKKKKEEEEGGERMGF